MKKIEKSISKIGEDTIHSNLEIEETELIKEQYVNMKITVKSYQEPSSQYFSSPCMLSEMEDQDEFFTIS